MNLYQAQIVTPPQEQERRGGLVLRFTRNATEGGVTVSSGSLAFLENLRYLSFAGLRLVTVDSDDARSRGCRRDAA